MRPIALTFLASAAIASALGAQDDPATHTLTALEDAWAVAVQAADVAALDTMVADDYFGTTAGGDTQTKAQYLADFTSGARRTSSLTTDHLRVRVYGETAVLTHGGSVTGAYRGTRTDGAYRWTHVFVRRDGRWQAVLNHVTKISDPGSG